MANQRVLGQHRPESTDFEAAVTVGDQRERSVVEKINVANLTASSVNYSIAVALQGESPSEENALAWEVPIPAKAHWPIRVNIPLANIGDRVMVKSSVGDALTFTLVGIEL